MERRISRRIFLSGAVGITGASLLLSACTPMTPGGTSSDAPQNAAESAEGVELVIWDPLFDPQQVLIKDLIAKYSELHPEVTFQYESIQYDEVHKKTTIAMAGGGGPDAFNVPSYTWARFIDTKTAVEIDPVAFGVQDMAGLEAGYVPNLLNNFKVDDKLSVIPTYVGSYLLLYNPTLFSNGFPTTWDAMLEAAKTINKFEGSQQTATTIRMGVDNGEHIQADLCPLIWANGGDLLNADRTQCALNQPAAVEGVAMMRRLVDEKAWVPNYPYSGAELFDGQAGCAVGGDWGFGDLDKQAAERGVAKVELAGWPVYKEGDRTHNYMQPWGWLVNSYSKHPAETWAALGYFMNTENAKRWQVETSQYTGVVADWVDEMHQADPRLKLSHDQLSFAHLGLVSVKFDEVMQPIVEAIQAIMYENASIQETLDEACAKVNEILKA